MRSMLYVLWRRLLHFLWCYTPYRMRVLQVIYAPCAIHSQWRVIRSLKGYRIILPLAGLGDLVMIAQSIRCYKRIHANAKFALVVGVSENAHVQLARLFPDAFDRIEQFYLDAFRHCYFPKINTFRNGVKKFANSKNAEQNFAMSIDKGLTYVHECFDGNIPSSDYVLKLFGGNARFSIGKTVLLCPAANSCGVDNDKWWTQLACEIKKLGLYPVFNTRQEKRYGGCDRVFLNLTDTIGFVEKGGFALSIRSGMCDILAYFTHAQLLVLWPDAETKWNKTTRTPWISRDGVFDYRGLMRAWSVQRIFPRRGISEFALSKSTEPSEVARLLTV